MTDIRTTQAIAEQWQSGSPDMQATQLVQEQWITVQTTNPQMIVTSVLFEQWIGVVPDVQPGAAQSIRVMILA